MPGSINLITAVVFAGDVPEQGSVARLQRGGLKFCVCKTSAEVPAAIQDLGCTNDEVLVLGCSDAAAAGVLLWSDVAPHHQAWFTAVPYPRTDDVMQAIVQHNRQCILSAASTAAASGHAEQKTCHTGSTAPCDSTAGSTAACSSSSMTPPVLVVGYVMKSSREEVLASAGMLHLLPIDGFCFMPLDPSSVQDQHQQPEQQQRLDQQRQQHLHIDVLLHKGSDELIQVQAAASPQQAAAAPAALSAVGVGWSPRLQALQSWLQDQPGICVVDPFEHTAKVLDRLLLSEMLQQLRHLQLPGGVTVRAPQHYQVNNFGDPDLAGALAAAGVHPPFIIKPRVACGVSHSHSMALVLSSAALVQLQDKLPLPAIVQEFVNHGGCQYKVYVMGDKVFMTPRASIPDVHPGCGPLPGHQQYLLFDSLASLPTQLPSNSTDHCQEQDTAASQQQQHGRGGQLVTDMQPPSAAPDMSAVEAIAACLRQQLGLTLFGFDVVVVTQPSNISIQQQQQQTPQPMQQSSQELVVIDVNYFPNYKGGSNTPALFRGALRQSWQQHQHMLNHGA